MDIKDLVGLSEPLKKLIEVISQGVGALSRPYLIRKTADAKAYEIEIITKAVRDNQQDLKQVGFDNEKLSLMSLDGSSIQKELSIEERTLQRVYFMEQKRQKNIENITQIAAENLESEPNVSDEPVDEDWTTRFFKYAEDISNEEMQELWGKVLAGEIKQPKSYSLRTLDTLRNLSKEEAHIFTKFANLAIKSNKVTFMLNFMNEKLLIEKYKLNFNDRLLLEELGLIATNDLSFQIVKTGNNPIPVVFLIGDICVIQNKLENTAEQALQVLVFTKIGQELLNLLKITPDFDYIQLLATKLNHQNGSVKYGHVIKYLPDGKLTHTVPLLDVPLT